MSDLSCRGRLQAQGSGELRFRLYISCSDRAQYAYSLGAVIVGIGAAWAATGTWTRSVGCSSGRGGVRASGTGRV